MGQLSEVQSALTGSETAHVSYFRGRDGDQARAVVEAHKDAYFKLAVVAAPADLQMVCGDYGVAVLPERAEILQGTLCHFVARLHDVHLIVDAFASQGQKIAPFYVTPLAPYALTEQGLRPVHLSSLAAAGRVPVAPQPEAPARVVTTAFEAALMHNHPHIAFAYEATSAVHSKQALSRQVDEQLLVQGGVLHSALQEPQGVLFIAHQGAAEKIAKLPDVSVQLVRPLEAFASHYEAEGELFDLPRIDGRPQYVRVPVSNGRISVLKLSQGAN